MPNRSSPKYLLLNLRYWVGKHISDSVIRTLSIACAALLGMISQISAQIKIGAVYCHGDQQVLDAPSAIGARLAVDQVNRAGGIGGRSVELIAITPDSSSDSVKNAVSDALEKNPGISAFVGLSDTDLALAAGSVAKKKGLPFVTSGATSPKLPAALGSRFFLACFGDNVQAAAAAQWLRDSKNCRTVAVLIDPSHTYTRLLAAYFSKAFRSGGGKITAQSRFQPGRYFKISPSILKADAVFLAAESPKDAIPVIQRLRSMGFAGPIVGGDGLDVPDAWIRQSLAANVFFTTHAYPSRAPGSASSGTAKAFQRGFKKLSKGNNPDSFSGLGYDATRLLLQSIASAGSTDPEAIAKALQHSRLAGVTGQIQYTKGSRVPVKPVSIISAANPEDGSLQLTPSLVPAP
jgi:branched-chain amino acid transport system substrate-binding protein